MTTPHPGAFKSNARTAIGDKTLRRALDTIEHGFVSRRANAAQNLPEFDTLRDQAREIKDHTIGALDQYLEAFEAKLAETGGVLHWAETDAQACKIIVDLCIQRGAKLAAKSKSMITEEIALNEALGAAGITPVETDLGEYIIQMRGEAPSHIIAPAVHVTRDQIEQDFRRHHSDLDPKRPLDDGATLVAEARAKLRQTFLTAGIGITGANFLVAETGSIVLVTNEGNADLTANLPKTHIVVASIEKLVPTLEDASTILRLLARSATGQDFAAYTTFLTGPKRAQDPDGPDELHVVLLDNGRSNMLGTEFQDMLRCIRCGACLNHCPVYNAVGGHSYGWVYPGPMGSVLTPSLLGIDQAALLPNASTFCGRCEEVCPMRIPLPRMMRHWRAREFARHLTPSTTRGGLKFWRYFASRPALYHSAANLAMNVLRWAARGRGRLSRAPLARGWTAHRDLPAPEGPTFQAQWRKRAKSKPGPRS